MNVIEKFQGCLFGDASVIVASITECIAGTYYGIPIKYIKKAIHFFIVKYDLDLIEVIKRFRKNIQQKFQLSFKI